MEPMTKDELLAIVDDMRQRIAEGDSFEGFLNYLLPEPEDAESIRFRVKVGYRVGNSEGQGGFRMIGTGEDGERYRAYPDHPLYAIPEGVLDAARLVTAEAARWSDVDSSLSNAIADAVVAGIVASGFDIIPKGGGR